MRLPRPHGRWWTVTRWVLLGAGFILFTLWFVSVLDHRVSALRITAALVIAAAGHTLSGALVLQAQRAAETSWLAWIAPSVISLGALAVVPRDIV